MSLDDKWERILLTSNVNIKLKFSAVPIGHVNIIPTMQSKSYMPLWTECALDFQNECLNWVYCNCPVLWPIIFITWAFTSHSKVTYHQSKNGHPACTHISTFVKKPDFHHQTLAQPETQSVWIVVGLKSHSAVYFKCIGRRTTCNMSIVLSSLCSCEHDLWYINVPKHRLKL